MRKTISFIPLAGARVPRVQSIMQMFQIRNNPNLVLASACA